jgi:hypothetical protein
VDGVQILLNQDWYSDDSHTLYSYIHTIAVSVAAMAYAVLLILLQHEFLVEY